MMQQTDPYAAFSVPASAAPPVRVPATPQRQPQRAVPTYSGVLPTDAQAVFPHLVAQESGGRAGVLGPQTRYGQAQGRTQMLPETARETAQRLGVPWRPELMTGTTPEAAAYQDQLGLGYLQEGLSVTGNMRDALRYYHGGPDRDLWGPKTNAYAEEVLTRYGGAAPGASAPAAPAMPGGDPYAGFSAPAADQPQQEQPAHVPPKGGSNILDLLRKPWLTREPVRIVPPAPVEYDEQGNEIIQINTGIVRNRDGSYNVPENLADGSAAIYRLSADEFARWEEQRNRQNELNAEEITRRQDPAYQAEYAAARARSDNVPAFLENLTQGGTLGGVPLIEGVLGWLDPNTDVSRGMASQAARDASRDRQATLIQNDPAGTIGAQLLGGLVTPGLKGTGDWIGAGQGGYRLTRAAAVGAGYGAAAGAIGGEGGLQERAGDAVRGGLLGAGVGAVGQGVTDRLLGGAAAARNAPSQARLLSRQGVDLTPGQMAGGPMQRIEEAAQSFPILGDAIKSARNRNMGTFDRAAINDALSPIGATVQGSGREAIGEADRLLSAEYDRILDPLTVVPDQQFQADVAAALNPRNLSRTARQRLADATADLTDRFSGPISGRDFKQLDSEIGALIRSADAGGPDQRPLVQPLRDLRDALNGALGRQDPAALDAKRAADTAYGNFDRIRRAAANPATARSDGLFSPGNLNSVLARTEGRNYARGEARLQELSDAGVAVLGDRVPDSGTPLRSLLTMGLPAAGGATMAGQGNAVAITAAVAGLGSLGYGKVAQDILNALYRRSDPGAVQEALGQLSRIAARDPAALAFYDQLVQQLLPEQARPQAEPSPGLPGTPPRSRDNRPALLSPQ